MHDKNTIKGLGRKEAELVARLMYENKKIVTTEDIDIALKRINQAMRTLT